MSVIIKKAGSSLNRHPVDRRNQLLLFVLSVVCLWPFQDAFGRLRMMGVVLNPQRVIIPLVFMYALCLNQQWRSNRVCFKSPRWKFLFSMWLIWGIFLSVFGAYTVGSEPWKEMISVALSFMVVYSVSVLMDRKELYVNLLRFIRLLLVFSILFGLFELVSGFHLPFSAHNAYIGGYGSDPRLPTGQFFGLNDYASYLAFFLPLLFHDLERTTAKISSLILFVSVIYILVRNDAIISLVGVGVGLFALVFVTRNRSRKNRIVFYVSVFLSSILILTFLVKICLDLDLSFISDSNRFTSEMQRFRLNTGTLFLRLQMYRDTLEAIASNYFLGMGPASMTSYIAQSGHNLQLLNPHSYHLEVLFGYGIIVYVFLMYNYYRLMKLNINEYHRIGELSYVLVASSFLILLIVCNAPSRFLHYQYPWLLFGVGVTGTRSFESNDGFVYQ